MMDDDRKEREKYLGLRGNSSEQGNKEWEERIPFNRL